MSQLVDLSLVRMPDGLPADPAPVEAAAASIRERRGPGAEMLGWMDLPHRQDEEFERLQDCAARLGDEVEAVVVVGIGGSYLGARAVVEALEHGCDGPRLIFAGHHLEGSYHDLLLDALEGREVAINVISKSGTTTEPALAFRLLRQRLESLYGKEKARRRIVATTDRSRGALRQLADEEGYESFVVPDDVGGRFSVLSPVGLLPLACAGVDVEGLLEGAAAEAARCARGGLSEVPALQYAALRYEQLRRGMVVEMLATFHPEFAMLAEWWKQLFGESEGKAHRGLLPASVVYTTDLHSLGQYLQDGARVLFESFLRIAEPAPGPTIPSDPDDRDGLNYLAGRRLGEINAQALDAVADAHAEGGVPSLTLTLPRADAPSLGSLLYFFEFAVAVGGRLLEVNPFDQPGVEAYKQKLFAVLGRPGS